MIVGKIEVGGEEDDIVNDDIDEFCVVCVWCIEKIVSGDI